MLNVRHQLPKSTLLACKNEGYKAVSHSDQMLNFTECKATSLWHHSTLRCINTDDES